MGVHLHGWNPEEDDQGSRVVTHADGRFAMPVSIGRCKITAPHNVAGYFAPTRANSSQVNVPPPEWIFDVPANEEPQTVVIKLARGLTVQGIVIGTNGKPQVGARITARNDGSSPRYGLTDEDGKFRIVGLSPYLETTVTLMTGEGYAERKIAPTPDQPWDQSLAKAVLLKLTAGQVLTGLVQMDGQPAPGIKMKLLRSGPEQANRRHRNILHAEFVTDKDGRYRVTGLQEGDKYKFEITAPRNYAARSWVYQNPYVQTVGDAPVTQLPVANLVLAGQTLSGVVVDQDGKGLPGITVTTRFANGGRIVPGTVGGNKSWVTTDQQGRFTLRGLPEEKLELTAYLRGKPGFLSRQTAKARPALNAKDIRIVLDHSIGDEPEDLDADK